jgi:hypothetical protein
MVKLVRMATVSRTEQEFGITDNETDLKKAQQEEHERFGKVKPLPTFRILSVDPLLMRVGRTIHDSVRPMILLRSFGSYRVSVIGLESLLRFVCESSPLSSLLR